MKLHYLAALSLIAGAASVSALEIGDAMVDTDVKMEGTDGKTHTLGGIKGEKGTLVIFTCNKCPFVQAWQDQMVDIAKMSVGKGLGVAFINSNDPAVKGDTLENMKTFARETGYTWPYIQDSTSDVARSFGAKKTPDVFLFDAEGKLAYKGAVGEGGRSVGNEIWLKDAIEAMLAGKPIEKAETKAIGCTIKFR